MHVLPSLLISDPTVFISGIRLLVGWQVTGNKEKSKGYNNSNTGYGECE